jgi:hypothetical protein
MKFFRKLRRSLRKRTVAAVHRNRFFVADYLGADYIVCASTNQSAASWRFDPTSVIGSNIS